MAFVNEDWGFCGKCNKFHAGLVPPKNKPIVIETKVVTYARGYAVSIHEIVPWPAGTRVRVTIERVSTSLKESVESIMALRDRYSAYFPLDTPASYTILRDMTIQDWADGFIKELEEHMHCNRPPSYKALQQDGYDLAVGQMLKFLKGSDGYRRLLDEMK
jgi:hypothetical protein